MTDRYAAERGIPAVPGCARSTLTLRFDGRFLTLGGPTGRRYEAVSGMPGLKGRFSYSATRQRISHEGPIPEGEYWIQPSEMWTNRWYSNAPRDAWGNHRITIHVSPGTKTHGRGGFFIHGGAEPGSAGCIDLHVHMDAFVRDLRKATDDDDACYVPLTVQYQK